MADLLDQSDLSAALADLPGVAHAGVGRLGLRVRAASFPDAVSLIAAVAEVAEGMDHHPDVDLRWRDVTFVLSTHSAGGVTGLDLRLAARIRELAAAAGAELVPFRDRVEVALDAADPDAVREFWRVGLGYTEQQAPDDGVELHHPDGAGPVLWFQRMDPPRPGRGRFHLDVYVPADAAQQRLTDTLAAGGTLVSDAHAPDWWVLADVEGNELCICVTQKGW